MRLAALVLCLVPLAAGAQSRFTAEEAALLQDGLTVTADAFILPAHDAFATAAAGLETAFAAYCDGNGDRDALHAAYADSFLAWQRVSVVGLGPVLDAEGPMRFQLWPDPKGFSARAIRQATAAEDPALLAPGALNGRSIALTNLTALEDLAYGTEPGTFACDLGTAIAAEQAAMAGALADGWRPGSAHRTAYGTADRGNATYGSVDDVLRGLLDGLSVQTHRIRADKIGRGLGEAPGGTRPERTEARASGLGLASLAASLRAMGEILTVEGGVFDVTPEVGGSKDYALQGGTMLRLADMLDGEARRLDEIAREDGEAATELRNIAVLTGFLETYLTVTLPGSIGLTTGFSSSDGD